MSIYQTELVTLDGEKTTLSAWQGNVLLVVNVASKCGLTPQYEALENIHRASVYWVFRAISSWSRNPAPAKKSRRFAAPPTV
ncbi:hypothetical protein DSJ_12895 [Pantoea stewartii subsp. stewartii DC283]|uniref:Glutathione peroxidase n=1 Tax=Pantoea stewartii subsp. stewartii DC283 TaxID=660596 RepID=A0ABM6K694_PANSE|nr:hypothetical protein DSJ_12895 [Pantoea stewartii subsp. stewartii DC283]